MGAVAVIGHAGLAGRARRARRACRAHSNGRRPSQGIALHTAGPAALHAGQRLFKHRRRHRPQRVPGGGIEFGAVHLARPVWQVVGLVDQQRHAPALGLGQAVQQRAAVKPVVVVAHQHIAPARQLLAQVVGAHLVGQRGLAQRLLCQRLLIGLGHGGSAGGGQAVVKAPGQRARVALAQLVGVLAGLVARDEVDHPQRQRAGRRVEGYADGCAG